MAFIPAVNTVKVALLMTDSGQEVVNTFHFHKGSAITDTDLDNILTAISSTFWGLLKADLSVDIAAHACTATDLTTSSSPSKRVDFSPAANGGLINSPSLPTNVALVVTNRSASRGRSYRGRQYICGCPTSRIASPTEIGTTQITNLLTTFATLLNTANTAGLVWSILSLFTGNAPRAAGIATPIISTVINTALDSQRRRLLGRGN